MHLLIPHSPQDVGLLGPHHHHADSTSARGTSSPISAVPLLLLPHLPPRVNRNFPLEPSMVPQWLQDKPWAQTCSSQPLKHPVPSPAPQAKPQLGWTLPSLLAPMDTYLFQNIPLQACEVGGGVPISQRITLRLQRGHIRIAKDNRKRQAKKMF